MVMRETVRQSADCGRIVVIRTIPSMGRKYKIRTREVSKYAVSSHSSYLGQVIMSFCLDGWKSVVGGKKALRLSDFPIFLSDLVKREQDYDWMFFLYFPMLV